MKRLFFFVAVIISGCASGPTNEEIIQGWMGRHAAVLEKKAGMPDRVMESASGQIVYIYNRSRTHTTPTTSKVVEPIGAGLGGPFAPKAKIVHSGGQTHEYS